MAPAAARAGRASRGRAGRGGASRVAAAARAAAADAPGSRVPPVCRLREAERACPSPGRVAVAARRVRKARTTVVMPPDARSFLTLGLIVCPGLGDSRSIMDVDTCEWRLNVMPGVSADDGFRAGGPMRRDEDVIRAKPDDTSERPRGESSRPAQECGTVQP